MKNIFVIGAGDPSIRYVEILANRPEFRGIVETGGGAITPAFLSGHMKDFISKLNRVSLINFLNFVKKNPETTTLVSFYDFSGGHRFLQSLKKFKRLKFEIVDYYNYYINNGLDFSYLPVAEERKQILGAKNEWKKFREILTDDYSKLTLDCYLAATETKDLSKMLPAYAGFENMFINRYSRKLSLVPHGEEVFIDVGAWDGDTIEAFVDCATTYKAIHAFEPSPSGYKVLDQRKSYLDNLHTYPYAVSNMAGEIDFYAADGIAARVADLSIPAGSATQRVKCVKLDDIIEEATMIKIEVEGHEPAVIEGAANLIKKCRPDMCVYAYHFPLDPIRIVETMNKIHRYKHISLRAHTVGTYVIFMYFSDRAAFE